MVAEGVSTAIVLLGDTHHRFLRSGPGVFRAEDAVKYADLRRQVLDALAAGDAHVGSLAEQLRDHVDATIGQHQQAHA